LLRDVYKNYGKVRALYGVNLEVQPGVIFGFLGPMASERRRPFAAGWI